MRNEINFLILGFCLLVAGCGSSLESVTPGRGALAEIGPMAKVYPKGEAARVDRHGLWRGMNGDQVVWEVRYTRGVPTGPYREWNAAGELIATWPYNWEGEIEGWARWFENGKPAFKAEINPLLQPEFDTIGDAGALKEWLKQRPVEIDGDSKAE
jgi:hypothetical protein